MSNSAQQILAGVIIAVAFIGFFAFMFILNRKAKK
jgi:type IV secretory pathway TrbL component